MAGRRPALEERSATLERDARTARLRWNRREQSLLARVSSLHGEAQLAALEYQRRLHRYMAHKRRLHAMLHTDAVDAVLFFK